MSTEDNGKAPIPSNDEYHSHEDRRKRPLQRVLNASHVSSNNFEDFVDHGKVHAVQFKISPLVAETGEKVAKLYNLSLSQYCKALLYQNLAIYEQTDRRRKKRERVRDQRRRAWLRQKKRELQDEEFGEEGP